MWAAAGELDVFDAGWMSDHLTDAGRERGGAAFEAATTAAALAHRLPGRWLGVAVFAATFRHPAVLANSAMVIDNVTGGRFILGLGAGWHAGEHAAYGIPLPAPKERFDRFESYVEVLKALFSDEARGLPGVTRPDPYFPLDRATLEPGPLRPTGPPLWLGGQRRRGIELAVRYADGWPMPGNRAGDVAYFADRHDTISRALEAGGRDAAQFTFAAQVACGNTAGERREALETSRRMRAAGANHLILSVPAGAGPASLHAMAEEVASPLLDD